MYLKHLSKSELIAHIKNYQTLLQLEGRGNMLLAEFLKQCQTEYNNKLHSDYNL